MRRRQFVSLLGGTALAPLTALPVYADPPGDCGIPLARDDGWPIASVNDDKLVDRDALCRMADRLVASSGQCARRALVARGGKLVFERYFFHGGNRGSNPLGDAKYFNILRSTAEIRCPVCVPPGFLDDVLEQQGADHLPWRIAGLSRARRRTPKVPLILSMGLATRISGRFRRSSTTTLSLHQRSCLPAFLI